MKAILDRLCRVVEWVCFGALIIFSYSLIAGITNEIIDANTPEQVRTVEREADLYDALNDTNSGIEIGDTITKTIREKPDMFQLIFPEDAFIPLFFFLIVCYPVIYILNGKVRFIPWR